MKANVYVDGFNLYYGSLRRTAHKWLDLNALCQRLLPNDALNRIRYFTARVRGNPSNPNAPQRQDIYLRALRTIPHLSIHFGSFQENDVMMPLANPGRRRRMIEVVKTEEKGSDVNLGAYLVLDACRRDFEVAVLITNDSDLKEAVAIVQREFGLPVGIVNPHPPKFRSRALRGTFFKQIRPSAVAACQFPTALRDAKGTIQKPSAW